MHLYEFVFSPQVVYTVTNHGAENVTLKFLNRFAQWLSKVTFI